jgi:alkylation response protein AidB-like acyl-CoA dehydrogenase
MGIRASHTSNVVLNDCRIPAENKLGAPSKAGGSAGPGALGALMTLERTRPVVGAYALGIGRAAYEYALDYARERVQFGRSIMKNQGVSFMLADMAMAVDSARLMVTGLRGWPAPTHRTCRQKAQWQSVSPATWR